MEASADLVTEFALLSSSQMIYKDHRQQQQDLPDVEPPPPGKTGSQMREGT